MPARGHHYASQMEEEKKETGKKEANAAKSEIQVVLQAHLKETKLVFSRSDMNFSKCSKLVSLYSDERAFAIS